VLRTLLEDLERTVERSFGIDALSMALDEYLAGDLVVAVHDENGCGMP
jgi:hypothetical protein